MDAKHRRSNKTEEYYPIGMTKQKRMKIGSIEAADFAEIKFALEK